MGFDSLLCCHAFFLLRFFSFSVSHVRGSADVKATRDRSETPTASEGGVFYYIIIAVFVPFASSFGSFETTRVSSAFGFSD